MYYVLCCTLLYKYFTQRITVHKELDRRLSKIIEGYLFKKPTYMWKNFPGLVCFYTLIRAKFWLLGKSETTWNPYLISLQFSFLVLNGIRVEIGPGDRFWNSGLLVTIPVFAWVADLSKNTLPWEGEAELRGGLSRGLEPPERFPVAAPGSYFSLSPSSTAHICPLTGRRVRWA